MKRIRKIFIIFVLLIIPNSVFGASIKPSQSSIYRYTDYVIDSYDINIVVNENNTFDITENITAYFNTSKHGIYRKIPLKNTVNRLDGSSTTNKVRITDLNVNNEYTTSKSNGNYEIKIGSESKTVTGSQNYVISYNYNIGKDPLKDKDEFYFNIIGNEWDTVIGNITFTITMPKDFDSSTLGFSSGKYGSTANENVNYVVKDNVIVGNYEDILEVGEALTVRLELEDGYFVNAGLGIDFFDMFYIVPLIFLIISIMMWYKYGRDDKPVETVEFYPPSGFNSLEVGFLYKGTADNKDVISLLVYLANLGYISIIETEEKELFSKTKGFKLRKLKDYDGNNINEKLFLDNLFTKKYLDTFKLPVDNDGKIHFDLLKLSEYKDEYEKTENLVEVTSDDLYNKFYRTVDEILGIMNAKENRNKIFETNSINKNIILYLFIVITFFIISVVPFTYNYGTQSIMIGLMLGIFPAIGVCCIVNGIVNYNKNGIISIIIILFGIIVGCSTIPLIVESLNETKYLFGYIYGAVVVAVIMYIIKVIPKRTTYGNELLGKIKGFKTFLETAEKTKLEAMVMENPNYFYDILPYTYVLGVSEKWIEKFETISLQAPSWYDSSTGFNVNSFGSFMNTTMTSAQSAMTSSPSSSSGGSSGGGSSGGGSGGGGGGSW